MDFATLQTRVAAAGLALRGAFHPEPEDGIACGTLVLLGFAGGVGWPGFAAAPEARDGLANPLDRWSRRVIGALAASLGGEALFPFGGPPWLPFQRWARRAEPVHPSPLGILIHPDWGLWHAYRGAVALAERMALPPPDRRPSPCESCAARPCLAACPVGAFTARGYDVAACRAHVAGASGVACMEAGCAARRACPGGAAYRYGPAQAAFHMRAFRDPR
jgi:ferredoxin